MPDQLSELDRLQLQSLVWEPAGLRLLNELGDGAGLRTLDIGCGCLGWLRLLSNWVGPNGHCIGTEIADSMAVAARKFCLSQNLENVQTIMDDLFNSNLSEDSFNLVHARFQLAPIGKFEEQTNCYLKLLAPGGVLVLEDPDTVSWEFISDAPQANRLIELILQAFATNGGDFNAGRFEFDLLTEAGFEPQIRAEVIALPPTHPYLQLPIQFATSLRPRLLEIYDPDDLEELITAAANEIATPGRRGLSFALIQTWVKKTAYLAR